MLDRAIKRHVYGYLVAQRSRPVGNLELIPMHKCTQTERKITYPLGAREAVIFACPKIIPLRHLLKFVAECWILRRLGKPRDRTVNSIKCNINAKYDNIEV